MAPLHHILNLLNPILGCADNGVRLELANVAMYCYFHGDFKKRWTAPTIRIQTETHHSTARRSVEITTGWVAHATLLGNLITRTNTAFNREGPKKCSIYTLSVGCHNRYRHHCGNTLCYVVPEIHVYIYGVKTKPYQFDVVFALI